MARIEKINPSQTSRWPWNLSIGTVSVTHEMRTWLKDMHGHDDVFRDERTQNWHNSATDEPDEHEDIVYLLWGPGYIQFKHEEDMIAFILRFSG